MVFGWLIVRFFKKDVKEKTQKILSEIEWSVGW